MARQYDICPYCDDRIDFGEKCYCREEKAEKERRQEELYIERHDGQIQFKEACA